MRSTLARVLVSRSLMSPYRVTSGQCFCKTFVQNESFSTCHSHMNPARSRPRSIPPIPEKSEPKVRLDIDHLRIGYYLTRYVEQAQSAAIGDRLLEGLGVSEDKAIPA